MITQEKFLRKIIIYHIQFDGTDINFKSAKLNLVAGNLTISGSSTNSYIKIGTITGITDTSTTNKGVIGEIYQNIVLNWKDEGNEDRKTKSTECFANTSEFIAIRIHRIEKHPRRS